ncbi:MAG: hypothetical protein JSR77_11900 [Planctomycetes bacterium]|nr:hypothetical protein [Planctomycetota bacterium]
MFGALRRSGLGGGVSGLLGMAGIAAATLGVGATQAQAGWTHSSSWSVSFSYGGYGWWDDCFDGGGWHWGVGYRSAYYYPAPVYYYPPPAPVYYCPPEPVYVCPPQPVVYCPPPPVYYCPPPAIYYPPPAIVIGFWDDDHHHHGHDDHGWHGGHGGGHDDHDGGYSHGRPRDPQPYLPQPPNSRIDTGPMPQNPGQQPRNAEGDVRRVPNPDRVAMGPTDPNRPSKPSAPVIKAPASYPLPDAPAVKNPGQPSKAPVTLPVVKSPDSTPRMQPMPQKPLPAMPEGGNRIDGGSQPRATKPNYDITPRRSEPAARPPQYTQPPSTVSPKQPSMDTRSRQPGQPGFGKGYSGGQSSSGLTRPKDKDRH